MSGTLYVVATPLGNREDLSPRAARILAEVDTVACEDTRTSGAFLASVGIEAKRLTACHKFNEENVARGLAQRLAAGETMAVITDAGTPCVSDPGTELVAAAAAEGVTVTPVPGPSAVIAALSVSGFNTISFAFYGFFPKKDGEIASVLRRIAGEYARVAVFYESPRRIRNTVAIIRAELPGAELCLCNDLTKKFERIYRGSPAEVGQALAENPDAEKGEYAMVIKLPKSEQAAGFGVGPRGALLEAVMEGIDLRDALRLPALNALYTKNELKKAAIEIKERFEL